MTPGLDHLADPVILAHAVAALLAVAGGIALLTMRKGTRAHRLLGRVWALAMLTAAISSLFIRATVMPVGRFGPIHLLSLLTIGLIVTAVLAIRRGDLATHRKAMVGAFRGLAIAGLFALAPGRAMNAVGHEVLAWLAQVPAVVAEAAGSGPALRAQPVPMLTRAAQADVAAPAR